jgi:hypothetical protein
MNRVQKAVLAATAFSLLTNGTMAQNKSSRQQGADARRWIKNCVANEEKPEARQAFTKAGKPIPSHSQNVDACIGEWNKFHPNEKIYQ